MNAGKGNAGKGGVRLLAFRTLNLGALSLSSPPPLPDFGFELPKKKRRAFEVHPRNSSVSITGDITDETRGTRASPFSRGGYDQAQGAPGR